METESKERREYSAPEFTSKPVPKEILDKILASAFETPVSYLYFKLETVHFTVVTNKDLLEKVWRYIEFSRNIPYRMIHEAPVLVLVSTHGGGDDPSVKSMIDNMIFTAMGNHIDYYALTTENASLKWDKDVLKQFKLPKEFKLCGALILGTVSETQTDASADPRAAHERMITDIQ